MEAQEPYWHPHAGPQEAGGTLFPPGQSATWRPMVVGGWGLALRVGRGQLAAGAGGGRCLKKRMYVGCEQGLHASRHKL